MRDVYLVGDILRQDVLYFYEPCRKLSGQDINGLECLALLERCGTKALRILGSLRQRGCGAAMTKHVIIS